MSNGPLGVGAPTLRGCQQLHLWIASRRLARVLIPLILGFGLPASSPAQTCNTTPVAVDDEVLHQGEPIIVDVLANDLEPDGEALAITELSTTCHGTVSEDLGLVTLVPAVPASEECTIAYQVVDERGAVAGAMVAVHAADLLFQDGFESGDTSVWPQEVGS